MPKRTQSPDSAHPFGGCNALQLHYQRVGKELCTLDFGISRYGFSRNYENFRVGVSTVPVEVLDSYLEDLLDIEVSDEKLFISRRHLGNFFHVLAILGLSGAFAWGLWSVARGAAPAISFFLTIFMAAPFAILWHFAPRMKLLRRLGFARILSQEISRRRGCGRGDENALPSSALSEFLSARGSSNPLQGTAKKIYH